MGGIHPLQLPNVLAERSAVFIGRVSKVRLVLIIRYPQLGQCKFPCGWCRF